MRPQQILLLFALLLAACGQQGVASEPAQPAAPTATAATATSAPAAAERPTLTIMSHDSFNLSESVVREFEQANNVTLAFRKSGDAGSALNQAILSKGTPLADLFFGVDNTFLSRALAADIFDPYAAPGLANIPAELQLDPGNQLLPVDYGYVTINYDKAALEAAGLAPPSALADLTRPEWKGKLVVQNPATSSPGLAFLIASIATFGESGSYGWQQFWSDLRANDVLVAEDWESAYYTHFSGSSGKGPRPLVVSYATSPAAEVFFSEGKLSAPPTGNVLAGAFRQIEFVGILKGTQQRALAEKFIDFMLGTSFQEDIPLQMFVYPASQQAALPDLFTQYAAAPSAAVQITPAAIDQGREAWIGEWTKIVLR